MTDEMSCNTRRGNTEVLAAIAAMTGQSDASINAAFHTAKKANPDRGRAEIEEVQKIVERICTRLGLAPAVTREDQPPARRRLAEVDCRSRRSLVLAECCADLIGPQWFRKVPALPGVAAEGAQPGCLAIGFDTLCGDGETERVGEVDHCSGDLFVGQPVVDVAAEVLDELSGEFDHGDGRVRR